MKAYQTATGVTCDECSREGMEVEIPTEYNCHCVICDCLINTTQVLPPRKTLADYPNA